MLTHEQTIYSISQLNAAARALLENHFVNVWVEGEISNFIAAQSGHWYFSLKDAAAQIRCAMFKGQQRKVDFTPKDGHHVLIKARISLYEARGEYQLIAEAMEERGEGKLRREFEKLKIKLFKAGLFAAEHKQALPLYPKRIGIITSPTGAAVRDILHVLKRRFACCPVIIYPALVQGQQAAASIVNALKLANQHQQCDVLIVARGGGSLEDLWPFNEEAVAQAVFASSIPIISGVGHETDITITDYVADVRAPTPSAAAELVTNNCSNLMQLLQQLTQQLNQALVNKLQQLQLQLGSQDRQLQQLHPKRLIKLQTQQLEFAERSLIRLQLQKLSSLQQQLEVLRTRLLASNLPKKIINYSQQLQHAHEILSKTMTHVIHQKHYTLSEVAGKIDSLSPLATLKRGFAIACHHGKVLHSVKSVNAQDVIDVQMSDGSLNCKVLTVTTS